MYLCRLLVQAFPRDSRIVLADEIFATYSVCFIFMTVRLAPIYQLVLETGEFPDFLETRREQSEKYETKLCD